MTTEIARWIEEFLLTLLQSPTQVPLGETEVQPGDERIVDAVEKVVVPRLEELGPDEIRRHDKGDVVARFGPDADDGVLLQTYIVSQHANLMDPPSSSRLEGSGLGPDGTRAVGQGATQNKGAMAAAFAALLGNERPARPVWLAVNTEGRSSHEGSMRIIDDLGVKAACGIIAFGTDMKVSLGNRGRVDIEIRVKGESSHSSQPWLGHNPIEEAADVIARLRTVPLPEEHAILGRASATPYRFACHPVAPHTIPADVLLVVDRRLLPGEEATEAVEGVRYHLSGGSAQVEIAAGVSMLPAEVDPHHSVVGALLRASKAEGRAPETFWSLNAFDAGYACSKGIPTPMFGPGKRGFSGSGLVGTDAIPINECVTASAILRRALAELCGSQ